MNIPVGKILGGIVLAGAVILLVFNSFYSVSEQENAVVTQFGKIVRTDTAGLYFKIPFLQRVRMVDITTHGTGVGYTVSDSGQNIEDAGEGIMITSDFNLLNIDFYLEYKVDDPVAYLYYSEDPEGILKNIALASIRSVVSNYPVDDAMTTGKNQIQADVKETMMRELEENDIGLQVVNITVQDSEPPTDAIKQAFKAVETAKQGADTARNNALQYQNSQLPNAEAQADKIVQDATAAKEARIAEASGQASRFNAEYEEYIKFPEVTKKRMFYETMEDILPELKVIITDGDTQTLLPLDSFSGSGQADESGSGTDSTAGSGSGNGTAGGTAESSRSTESGTSGTGTGTAANGGN
ncbi:MAG: FtsH protease activity modulator HflK [Eubacterium sp.]|nr:FtsH protease activity modulator HflK [Eubacterium sp.]